MEDSSTSKLGRRLLVPARSKGQHVDIFKRGIDRLAEDGRRHEFSLDSLDKEILQTMSRGSKNTQVNFPSDSASESSGSAQEKAICSMESSHPTPVPYSYASPEYKRHQHTVLSNGVHSSESTSKTSKKPSEQRHCTSNIGQFHGPPLPMWPDADTRLNGYRQQVSVNVNGGIQQQDPGHWHHSGGTLHRPGGNNEMHVSSSLKDTPFRDVHSENSRLDAGLSSDTSGEDIGEETRRKQASEGPYSGSMGMFAYPGTPQRLFPGGHRNVAECPNVGNLAMGSPEHERATITHCPAQYSGGRSQQRSAMKSKVPKAPPSKWDDAGKWIASPGHNESATIQVARSNQGSAPSPLMLPGKRLTVAGQMLGECNEHDSPKHAASIADSSFAQNNEGNTSVVNVKDHIQQIESAIQNSLAKSTPVSDPAKRREAPRAGAKCVDIRSSTRSGADDKRRDTSVITSTMFVQRPKDCRLDALIPPPKLRTEPQAAALNPVSNFPTKKAPLAETPNDSPVKDIFSNSPHTISMSDFPGPISVRESGTDTAQPSSFYRDMGTQMTPNPSVRLSRGATPGTINISPGRHNTPDHSRRTASLGAPGNAGVLDLQSFHIEKLGGCSLGSQPHAVLDRSLNWSTREEEEEESATCLRTQDCGETENTPFVAWSVAWEEAERAKYTARFHQEEARIQAWEELQKAKAEAQMKKTEAKLEKMHESASQKMSNKIAAARRKAEDMRAAAEACRDELATKAKHRAEYIRQTGNAPTTLGCFASRLVPFQSNLQ